MKEITIDGIDYDCTPRFKPEPKFAVGDWVHYKGSNANVCIESLYGNKIITFNGAKGSWKEEMIELWKPTEGEWCVFWNSDSELKCSLSVEQYIEINEDGNYTTEWTSAWRNIAPLNFISTLKD